MARQVSPEARKVATLIVDHMEAMSESFANRLHSSVQQYGYSRLMTLVQQQYGRLVENGDWTDKQFVQAVSLALTFGDKPTTNVLKSHKANPNEHMLGKLGLG